MCLLHVHTYIMYYQVTKTRHSCQLVNLQLKGYASYTSSEVKTIIKVEN